jgi:L-histidine Nalpha-methyltransferase
MSQALNRPFAHEAERLRNWQVPGTRPQPSLIEDATRGLLHRPRSMPPKYFYDMLGSQLFDAICATPEYYPTRTEAALLAQHADEIIDIARPAHIVEFGSGSSRKTRHLLDACEARQQFCGYWPFDVCGDNMMAAGQGLIEDYPWLSVTTLVGDYQAGLSNLPEIAGRRLFMFLGGTIGNFTLSRAIRFLIDIRRQMRQGDWLLLGADRVKGKDVLHAAYNDSAGLTARFNMNLLHVLNRELHADFDLSAFRHEAYFNEAFGQIEMYLTADKPQRVRLGALDCSIEIDSGERILTEISRKFTRAALLSLFQAVHFTEMRHYEPDNGYYSLMLLRV